MPTMAADRMFILISCAAIIVTGLVAESGWGAFCSTEAKETVRPSLTEGSKHPRITQPRMTTIKLLACDFEVFGIVQGVFFRKYTQKKASSLGLRGWCMNTADGTVKGQLEGEEKPFNEMKHWLQTKGSPSSRIDKTVFNVPKEITSYTFKDFSIRR
ncbi:acylphosphatase-2-like [Anopheles bellator]|uniref:acylphosphatase-2-like n=1 Tax=Anopheles bellator TaxID=139047 RepID=UPI002649AC25|nr:acylphosphatase-2-like [Anopheles bellator]